MPAHIDFLFNLMGDLEKERIGVEEFNKKYGTDSFATVRLFNEKFRLTTLQKLRVVIPVLNITIPVCLVI